jgi:hypothetical protein
MLRFLNRSVQAVCIGFGQFGSLAFTFLSALGPWPVQSCRQHDMMVPSQPDEQRPKRVNYIAVQLQCNRAWLLGSAMLTHVAVALPAAKQLRSSSS